MALIAGTSYSGYEGSMAQAIETAFRNEWPKVMGSEAPASNEQMKLLFTAVAQGVVKHLVSHPEAFQVDVTILGITYRAVVSIKSEGILY